MSLSFKIWNFRFVETPNEKNPEYNPLMDYFLSSLLIFCSLVFVKVLLAYSLCDYGYETSKTGIHILLVMVEIFIFCVHNSVRVRLLGKREKTIPPYKESIEVRERTRHFRISLIVQVGMCNFHCSKLSPKCCHYWNNFD